MITCMCYTVLLLTLSTSWEFVLCIVLVHGSHPSLMYLFALAHVNPSGWLGLHHAVGHVMEVCPSLMSRPHE
jgi:hypothetical protein